MSKKTTAKRKPAPRTQSIFQNPWIWLAAGLLLVAIIAVGVALSGNNRTASQPVSVDEGPLPMSVTVAQARELQQQGALLLDVREQSEWEDYHVPGSTLIPLGELPNRLSELPTDQDIVVVCRSGNRSQSGRDILLNAGFSSVTSMTGGLLEWRSNGYPTVTGP